MTLARALVLIGLSWSSQALGFVWPSTVEQVARDLGSTDVGIRRRAASGLQKLSVSVSRRLVARAIEDSDVEVRADGAMAAIQLGLPITEQVIPWLTDSNASLRRIAAEVLEAQPDANATPYLGRVLSDPEPVVRAAAADALTASRAPDAAITLLGHIDDADPRVRESVLEGLAELRDKRTTLALMGKVQDPRVSVRRGAVGVLGKLRDARATGALIAALGDSESEVQILALDALGVLEAVDALPSIIPLARQTMHREVSESALVALARIHSPEALTVLIEVATSEEEERASLTRPAFAVAGSAALDALTRCISGQPVRAIADGCVRALGYVPSAKAGEAVLDALRRRVVSPSIALLTLAGVRTENSLGAVLEYLSSPDPVVRQSAILATAAALDPQYPDGRAVEPLTKALDLASGNRDERAQLLRLLGFTASPRAAAPLRPYLNAADARTRAVAIEALGSIGKAGQGEPLVGALADPDADVRRATALALRRLGDDRTAAPILSRIESGAEQDQELLPLALSGALSTVTDEKTLDRLSALIRRSHGGARDALIEAASYVPGKRGSDLLLELARTSVDSDDRAKVAEALANHPEARLALLKLAQSPVASVRTNALWALTTIGTPADVGYLRSALGDENPAAAANAMAALARIAPVAPQVAGTLCDALGNGGAYVRVNALVGLRLAKARCPGGIEQRLLSADRSSAVRRAAARLLIEVPTTPDALDADALVRCEADDPDGSVAVACARAAEPVSVHGTPVTIFVVSGTSRPAPHSGFALLRGDGLVRLGQADRRGAILEVNAPHAPLRLEAWTPNVE